MKKIRDYFSKLTDDVIEAKDKKIYKDYIITQTVLGTGKSSNDVLLIENIVKGGDFAMKIIAFKVENRGKISSKFLKFAGCIPYLER